MRSSKKIDRLWKLFDSQIETLQNLGCPKKIIDILREQRDRVIGVCLEIRIPPNRISFLPVITPAYYKVEELMAMVRNEKGKGEVCDKVVRIFDDSYPIIDAVGSQPYLRVYFDPYYVINVEDGTVTKGMDVRKACKKIILNQRSPLTVPESVSLCIYTDVLSRYRLWAAGSRWEVENKIPEISLTDFGGTPILSYEDADYCHEPNWATPSCGKRVD